MSNNYLRRVYSTEFPIHVTCRTNNREPWPIPTHDVWYILSKLICYGIDEYEVQVHQFLLMGNHYHLSISTPKNNISAFMYHLNKHSSTMINERANRQNHVYGGPYRPSLISTPEYYYHCYKYLYRNPCAAGISRSPFDYPYSTLYSKNYIPLSLPLNGLNYFIPNNKVEYKNWLNEPFSSEKIKVIQKGLKKRIFKVSVKRPSPIRNRILDLD